MSKGNVMGTTFIKVGVAYLIMGVLFGVLMHHIYDPEFGNIAAYFPREHSVIPLHAHVALLGGFFQIIVGLIYQVYPRAGKSTLGIAHFWAANIALLFILGRLVIDMAQTHVFGGFLEPVKGGIGSFGGLGYVLSLILFVTNIFKNLRPE
jgi:hypothetical protein